MIDTGNTQPAGSSSTVSNWCSCACCGGQTTITGQFIISMINSLSIHSTQPETQDKHGRRILAIHMKQHLAVVLMIAVSLQVSWTLLASGLGVRG